MHRRRKTGGTHIEMSPNARKRVAKTLRCQEAAWARRSGRVEVRNVFDDEAAILEAALSVAGPFGVCSLDEIVARAHEHDPSLDRTTVDRLIRERMSSESSPFTRRDDGGLRLRRKGAEAARPCSTSEDVLKRVRMEFVKPWE